MHFRALRGRLGDARENLEPRAASAQPRGFPRAVAANHAHHLAALAPSADLRTGLEGDVAQGPEEFGFWILDFGIRLPKSKIGNPKSAIISRSVSRRWRARPMLPVVFQGLRAEVQDDSQMQSGCGKIVMRLGAMGVVNVRDGLEFEDDFIIDDQIRNLVPDKLLFIGDRQALLTFEGHAA